MEEDDKNYRWESGYEKTWEAIREDEEGSIDSIVQDTIAKARRQRILEKSSQKKLGLMRYLIIILDLSESMSFVDLKPSRLHVSLQLLESFIEEYFYSNPISQCGLIGTSSKRAELLVELSGQSTKHSETLKKLILFNLSGEPSLQNSLSLAHSLLKHVPTHASREILLLMGSLTTCDPGDVLQTAELCVNSRIKVSVILLAAEVRIYREISKRTHGDFSVILDELHYKELLSSHCEPPFSSSSIEASLIRMGFPHSSGQEDSVSELGLCMCHVDEVAPRYSVTGFHCPQCHAKYCNLPVECQSCGLTLVSAPHLARSYHHLFPLPIFSEICMDESSSSCFSCMRPIVSKTLIYECPKCQKRYCGECDIFIHETLHCCPGCASSNS